MTLKLKRVLREVGLGQSDLARRVKLSPAAISLMVNHDEWPMTQERDDIEARITAVLTGWETSPTSEQLADLFATDKQPEPMPPMVQAQIAMREREQREQEKKNRAADCGHRAGTPGQSDDESDKETEMLLRKQTLTPDAKRAFGLVRNPFDEIHSADEVYMTRDIRYVRESMRACAKHGGFMAICGESGAGKSTLRRDLIEWANKEREPVIVIEPYVLGLEDNDMKGKTLKASHIAEAIMAACAPRQTLRRSPEARFRQVHNVLRESQRAGNHHVLVIEEAHGLPISTLKHLKRFFELEDGYSKLLSIILIGQTELAEKLDERNPSVREIVQRCEMVTLRPLDGNLEGYLEHRFKLAGVELSDVMDAGALDALTTKLTRPNFSALYPLAIHNVVTAALNEAAELGVPRVNADLIAGV